jgi:predicted RNase H-like nuclease (RuvC/YqgF family)
MSDPRTHAELSVDVAYAHRKWKEAEAELARLHLELEALRAKHPDLAKLVIVNANLRQELSEAKAELAAERTYSESYATALETVASLRTQLAVLASAGDALAVMGDGMLKMMAMLWEAVPWGKTFNLDVKALNEAPSNLRAALTAYRAARGGKP